MNTWSNVNTINDRWSKMLKEWVFLQLLIVPSLTKVLPCVRRFCTIQAIKIVPGSLWGESAQVQSGVWITSPPRIWYFRVPSLVSALCGFPRIYHLPTRCAGTRGCWHKTAARGDRASLGSAELCSCAPRPLRARQRSNGSGSVFFVLHSHRLDNQSSIIYYLLVLFLHSCLIVCRKHYVWTSLSKCNPNCFYHLRRDMPPQKWTLSCHFSF